MTSIDLHQTNRLLGYPPDARLLILNADDFGMCQSVNTAIIGTLKAGLIRSTSLMVPCNWSPQAMHFLKQHTEIPFGIHLTCVCDGENYRWCPLICREKVPSLIDPAGYFYTFDHMAELLAQARLEEMELEFRAQIVAVLAAGLKPTHLDWHSLRINGRMDIFELMFRLARDNSLALRASNQAFSARIQEAGLPANDHDLLDSYHLDPANKPARYAQLLHQLPAGLSEWAIHPGLDQPELLAMEPGSRHFRQADYDFWTSQTAKDLIAAEGITLLDYRAIQAVWQ
jgi:predicted glycoside hydrolase/deacetylase ChbG (UPF0249 family)